MYRHTWTENYSHNKKRFKELYGRKPTKPEIKMLRKGLIDLKLIIDPNKYVAGGERSVSEKIEIKQQGYRTMNGILHDV